MKSDFELGRDTTFSRAYVAFYNYFVPDWILREIAPDLDGINKKQFKKILEENGLHNDLMKSLDGTLISSN